MNKLQAIRGMHDVKPEQLPCWQFIEEKIKAVFHNYGYQEIRTPIVEVTGLFKRAIGEVSDIVEKEMYSFPEKNGTSLTLRPEGTAGCVRACIEHGLLYNQIQKLWYYGPMFRYERPQQGRYRQFHQIGVEAFGMRGPDIDLEILLLTAKLWKIFGLHKLELQINTLGTKEERYKYRKDLVKFLYRNKDQLDEINRSRLETNPLRVLDSKNPKIRALITDAPILIDYLNKESREHFDTLCYGLNQAGISYILNTSLVRGLDYYSLTVFEWVTKQLGTQETVCAGGRYDYLVEQLGGNPTPAIGFAIGIERLFLLLRKESLVNIKYNIADIYFISIGEKLRYEALIIADNLRAQLSSGIRLMVHCGTSSLKTQFKKADKSGALIALILGENELDRGTINVKFLRSKGQQHEVRVSHLAEFLQDKLNE